MSKRISPEIEELVRRQLEEIIEEVKRGKAEKESEVVVEREQSGDGS